MLHIDQPQQITLSDGRHLAYAEQGAPDGAPLFLFHGIPGSRLQRHPDSSIAERLGVRLITVDRPGYGLSTPKPNRRILDWPDDVTELADQLGIDRFGVIGVSGGGPYAMACAYRLPQRITRLALVSAFAPLEVPGMRESLVRSQRLQFALAKRAPWAIRLLFGSYLRAMKGMTPQAVRQKLEQDLPPSEQVLLTVPGFIEMLLADGLEMARGDASAIAQDLQLVVQPWSFSLAEIKVPTLLWQGEADTNVSLAMGEYLARTIPNCKATFCPGEAHLTGMLHWAEILQATATGH